MGNPIWLDSREGSGDLLGYLSPKKDVVVTQLDSGDAMGVGEGPGGPLLWAVEIKKLSDCLQALQDGRLVQQLGRMYEDYDWRLFLLEAQIRMCPETGKLQQWVYKGRYGFWCDVITGRKEKMMYGHFISWLMSVVMCSGAMLLPFTSSREETAAVLMSLNNFLSKPWEEHSALKVFDDSHPSEMYIPTIPMLVARSLADGMGWEKSAAAGAYFKTAKRVVNATKDEWLEVPGVGEVLAKRLVAGAEEEHVMRKRTRRSNGAAQGNVLPTPSYRSVKKRRIGPRKVSRPATKR